MTSRRLFETGKFRDTPLALRRLTDIAFSGDGEPTTHRNFDEVVAACADLKRQHQLDTLPLVLITNASMFHRDHVQRALAILDANRGEIWAKLDAGTAAYYERINRTPFGFAHILQNITQAAIVRPLVIQSLFMRIDGQPPPRAEWQAYVRTTAGNHRRGRTTETDPDLHDRPTAGRNLCRAAANDEVDAMVQSYATARA